MYRKAKCLSDPEPLFAARIVEFCTADPRTRKHVENIASTWNLAGRVCRQGYDAYFYLYLPYNRYASFRGVLFRCNIALLAMYQVEELRFADFRSVEHIDSAVFAYYQRDSRA